MPWSRDVFKRNYAFSLYDLDIHEFSRKSWSLYSEVLLACYASIFTETGVSSVFSSPKQGILFRIVSILDSYVYATLQST